MRERESVRVSERVDIYTDRDGASLNRRGEKARERGDI